MTAEVTSPAIEFRNVRKSYGARPALENFSLAVAPAETVALVGPSGCGKTTALKLVRRLLDAAALQVLVSGRDVRAEEPVPLRRGIGYVIQEGGLFPHWDVQNNIEIVPRLLGWTPERRHARCEELLTMVNLPSNEFRHRRPRELSGGQRQRVGFARALAADPPIVLMDEPFGPLDPIARRALQQEFLAWKHRLKKPLLLGTHDLPHAFRLADRPALLEPCRVYQFGQPSA